MGMYLQVHSFVHYPGTPKSKYQHRSGWPAGPVGLESGLPQGRQARPSWLGISL